MIISEGQYGLLESLQKWAGGGRINKVGDAAKSMGMGNVPNHPHMRTLRIIKPAFQRVFCKLR